MVETPGGLVRVTKGKTPNYDQLYRTYHGKARKATYGWSTIKEGKRYPNGVVMLYADPELRKQSGGDRWFVMYANETKMKTFPTKEKAQKFAAERRNLQ